MAALACRRRHCGPSSSAGLLSLSTSLRGQISHEYLFEEAAINAASAELARAAKGDAASRKQLKASREKRTLPKAADPQKTKNKARSRGPGREEDLPRLAGANASSCNVAGTTALCAIAASNAADTPLWILPLRGNATEGTAYWCKRQFCPLSSCNRRRDLKLRLLVSCSGWS